MEQAAAKNRTTGKKVFHHFDFPLFAVLLSICLFGLVMLYSASYYYALTKHGDGLYFLKRQLLCFGIGVGALFATSFINYKFYRKAAWWLYGIVVLLLAATLVIGETVNEATRWIKLGPVTFQPAELAKFGTVMVMARLMCSGKLKMQSFFRGVVPALLPLIPFAGLIILQPNLSMILILAFTAYVMLYLGGVKISHRLLLMVMGVTVIVLFIVVKKGYHADRIYYYLHPNADPTGVNFQPIQSRIALGNGGLFGQGLNFSRQKLNFLPERENDYILAIIGEELGFVGCFLLLAAYFFLVIRGTVIAMRCSDRFGRLLAGGITAVLAIQVILNVAVVTNAIPSTGQTLPFVSYGGTSIVIFLAAMGILLNISRYSEVEEKNAAGTEQQHS